MTALTNPAVSSDVDVRGVMQALVRIRYERGLTQKQVADRMGVDRSNVGHWEQGKHDLQLSSLLRYCRAIGVRLTAELVEGGDWS